MIQRLLPGLEPLLCSRASVMTHVWRLDHRAIHPFRGFHLQLSPSLHQARRSRRSEVDSITIFTRVVAQSTAQRPENYGSARP
jgi:hypothetical protein